MMSAGNDDGAISRLADELIDAEDVRPPSSPKIDENAVLYQMLDEAPHGRKLMNYMVYSRPPNDIHSYRKGPTQRRSLIISHNWLDEEKRANTQTTPAALQLETPVIFSWSKKAHDIKRDQVRKSQQGSTVRESTNDHLYKSVATQLNQIKSRENWDSNDPRPITMDNRDNNQSTKKSEWADPNFKVDPLQPFVAKLVKEPKKKPPKKEKTPSKMKTLFSFLSNSSKKEKSHSSDGRTSSGNSSQDESQEIEAASDVHEQERKQNVEPMKGADQVPISPSPSPSIPGTLQPVAPSAPPKLSSSQSFDANSPLSMDSFIPLQPKKKN